LIYQQAKRLEEIRKRLEKDSESENLTNDIIFMAQRNYTNAEDILVEQLMSLDSAIKRDRLAKKDTYAKIQEDFSQILGGKILEELTDINGLKVLKWKYHFKDKKETIALPLSQSSSMVNQLACLALYFDYMARGRRDFLFIDEPEENLHPKAQTALLDVLLEFASMNENRVLIASHSPLMADALNNYIYWANIRDKANNEQKVQQPEGLNADIQGLSASDFVVYSFEANGKVKEYGFDEIGVYFKSFETEQKNIQYIQQDLMEIEHKLKEIANI
jgi:predicted ATP-dependent endonuclease of OLD family